jgi:hypothetical protein
MQETAHTALRIFDTFCKATFAFAAISEYRVRVRSHLDYVAKHFVSRLQGFVLSSGGSLVALSRCGVS